MVISSLELQDESLVILNRPKNRAAKGPHKHYWKQSQQLKRVNQVVEGITGIIIFSSAATSEAAQ